MGHRPLSHLAGILSLDGLNPGRGVPVTGEAYLSAGDTDWEESAVTCLADLPQLREELELLYAVCQAL